MTEYFLRSSARSVLFAMTLVVTAFGVAAIPLQYARAGNTAEVTIDNFTFAPAELTVSAGTTVIFINHDDIPHSVVDKSKRFRSKALDTDDSYSFTFTEAGTYDYFCGLHPHMTGKIVVKP